MNVKQFLGSNCMSNDKVAAQIKEGAKCKILEADEKTVPATKEMCLGVKVKECDGWIRVNKTDLAVFIARWGEESDKYIGKFFVFHSSPTNVGGTMRLQLRLVPVA